MPRYRAPRTVGLPMEDWPPLIQQAWKEALEPGGVFTDPGGLSHLKPKTLRTVRSALEKWLFNLDKGNKLQAEASLDTTYTHENLRRYIKVLRSRVKNRTVCTQLRSLSQAFGALCPALDRCLLQHAINRLRKVQEPKRLDLVQLAPLGSPIDLGRGLMTDWLDVKWHDRRINAIHYRDGLLIFWLCHMPLRRENLAEMDLGEHLRKEGNTWIVSFPASSMKGKRALQVVLPDQLVGPLEYYLAEVRPLLTTKLDIKDALWPSYHYTKTTESGISTAVKNRTREHLGMSTPPHDIRHIVATELAELDPEFARLAAGVLQHNGPKTTEEHYIRATHHQAARKYNRSIEALLDDADADDLLIKRLTPFLEENIWEEGEVTMA